MKERLPSQFSQQESRRAEAQSFLMHVEHRLERGEQLREVLKEVREKDLSGEGEIREGVRVQFEKLIKENSGHLKEIERSAKNLREKPTVQRREVVDPTTTRRAEPIKDAPEKKVLKKRKNVSRKKKRHANR